MAVQQNWQGLVVGAATGFFCSLLACRTVRKITNATIRKLITVLRNWPYAIDGRRGGFGGRQRRIGLAVQTDEQGP